MAAPHADPSELQAAKQAARALLRARRAGCDPGLGRDLARYVMADPPPPGAVVSGYLKLAGEIDIAPLLQLLAENGCRICLPVTPPRGQALTFRLWQPGAPLLRGAFATWAPLGPPAVPDVLLVPLLGFDRAGRRLGYGGGYYDRTLAALPGARAIGCGFAVQELDEVPAGPYDARLAMVATEHGLIDCRRGLTADAD